MTSEKRSPARVTNGNSPEFVAQAARQWLEQRATQTIYMTPSSPWERENREKHFTESSVDKLRDECLKREMYRYGQEASAIVEAWRDHYNSERPNSALSYQTVEEFVAVWQAGRRSGHALASSLSLTPNPGRSNF